MKCPEDSEIRKKEVDVLVKLKLDECNEKINDNVLSKLESVIGEYENDEKKKRVLLIVLEKKYYLISRLKEKRNNK
jgi:hypothetical protein